MTISLPKSDNILLRDNKTRNESKLEIFWLTLKEGFKFKSFVIQRNYFMHLNEFVYTRLEFT